MASYQIPQFLDSGDKILGPLNIRQFGYAISGFFFCVVIFSIFSPSLGNYAVIPCLPLAALTAYLALGKYNGRDSEIYVLKYILYNLKPRQMVYRRVAETSDLDEQLSKLTVDQISKNWNERVATQKQLDSNTLANFQNKDAKNKIELIKNIGGIVDTSLYSAMSSVKRKEIEIQKKEMEYNIAKGQPVPQTIPTVQPTQLDTNSHASNFFNLSQER